MKNLMLFSSLILVLVFTSSCVDKEQARQEAVQRLMSEAQPQIQFMQKLNRLVEEYGKREPFLHAMSDPSDKDFNKIVFLISRDEGHFTEVSQEGRYKNVDYSPSLHERILFIDQSVYDEDTTDSTLSNLANLDIGHFCEVIFEDSPRDYFLTEDECREHLEKTIQEWDGRDTTDYSYYAAKSPIENMKDVHEKYQYVAFIKGIYYLEPVNVSESSFSPGYIATQVSIYDIESESLYKEFMVYATNSETAYSTSGTITIDGREHTIGGGDPAHTDLHYNYKSELFYQLIKAGIMKPSEDY